MDERTTALVRRQHRRYTQNEVAAMLGVPYPTFKYHVRSQLVPAPQRGVGKRKYYSEHDVERLRELYQREEN